MLAVLHLLNSIVLLRDFTGDAVEHCRIADKAKALHFVVGLLKNIQDVARFDAALQILNVRFDKRRAFGK